MMMQRQGDPKAATGHKHASPVLGYRLLLPQVLPLTDRRVRAICRRVRLTWTSQQSSLKTATRMNWS